jgi:hypothetical protein
MNAIIFLFATAISMCPYNSMLHCHFVTMRNRHLGLSSCRVVSLRVMSCRAVLEADSYLTVHSASVNPCSAYWEFWMLKQAVDIFITVLYRSWLCQRSTRDLCGSQSSTIANSRLYSCGLEPTRRVMSCCRVASEAFRRTRGLSLLAPTFLLLALSLRNGFTR